MKKRIACDFHKSEGIFDNNCIHCVGIKEYNKKMNIKRILENKFYILYERVLQKNEIMNKYVIYRSEEYGHDFFRDFNNLRQAKNVFNKATKEAIEYEEELKQI